jgi:Mce-associated membrane protein
MTDRTVSGDDESAAVEPESTAIEADTTPETQDSTPDAETEAATPASHGTDWTRVLAYGILPGLVLLLALAAAYLKFVDDSVRTDDAVRTETVQAATDHTIKLLSYTPDQVEQQLGDARNLTAGQFRDTYTALINDVVIPGAREKQIAATASVPQAAAVSADPDRAVVLVFVNQSVVVGSEAPANTASSVRVTMDKVDDQWLISGFDPV